MAFEFDPKCYPYPSQKTVSYAKNGMVTTTNITYRGYRGR